jgi:hypothetical protein
VAGVSEATARTRAEPREAGYDRIMGGQERPADIRCDFCGKHESDGHSMVAGPGIYICNKCVELAIEVLEKRGVTVNR